MEIFLNLCQRTVRRKLSQPRRRLTAWRTSEWYRANEFACSCFPSNGTGRTTPVLSGSVVTIFSWRNVRRRRLHWGYLLTISLHRVPAVDLTVPENATPSVVDMPVFNIHFAM